MVVSIVHAVNVEVFSWRDNEVHRASTAPENGGQVTITVHGDGSNFPWLTLVFLDEDATVVNPALSERRAHNFVVRIATEINGCIVGLAGIWSMHNPQYQAR